MGAESYPTQRPNGHLRYSKDVAALRSRPCDSAPILGLREFCGVDELDKDEPITHFLRLLHKTALTVFYSINSLALWHCISTDLRLNGQFDFVKHLHTGISTAIWQFRAHAVRFEQNA